MSRILLLHSTDEFRANVEKACREQPGYHVRSLDIPYDVSRAVEIAAALVGSDPDLIVFGPLMAAEEAVAFAHAIDHSNPEISMIIVTTPTASVWAKALQAGVRDILTPDAPPQAIAVALERALDVAMGRKNRLAAQVAVPDRRGRVVTVISPKGGSGKTVVATNIAVSLAALIPNQVVIVDLDVTFGDVASSLRIQPTYSLYHAANTVSDDTTVIKGLLTPRPGGLLALCAPDEPEDADDMKIENVLRVIDQLAEQYEVVILDTGAGLDDLILAVVEVSTDLVVVGSTDVPTVTSLRKELAIFDRLGVTAKRHFVLNRCDARVGLAAKDIELTIGLPIDVSIPSSRAVPVSVNQ